MMSGEERRKELLDWIQKSSGAVSARTLAAKMDVSRQVIVQDIALLRASGYDILATNQGYLLTHPIHVERVIKEAHTEEETLTELNAIVDLGACVKDVFIRHKVYGTIRVSLMVNSRRKAAEFMEKIKSGASSPLMNITSGYHYHTITAESEEVLDLVEKQLKELGFLLDE